MVLTGLLAGVLLSCSPSAEERMKADVEAFANAYFNWHYQDAVRYTDEGSKRWLAYMASQVTQADVDRLRGLPEGAGCEVEALAVLPGDTVARATVVVRHHLRMEGIGEASPLIDEARYPIILKKRIGTWKVSLSGPLRPLKD